MLLLLLLLAYMPEFKFWDKGRFFCISLEKNGGHRRWAMDTLCREAIETRPTSVSRAPSHASGNSFCSYLPTRGRTPGDKTTGASASIMSRLDQMSILVRTGSHRTVTVFCLGFTRHKSRPSRTQTRTWRVMISRPEESLMEVCSVVSRLSDLVCCAGDILDTSVLRAG